MLYGKVSPVYCLNQLWWRHIYAEQLIDFVFFLRTALFLPIIGSFVKAFRSDTVIRETNFSQQKNSNITRSWVEMQEYCTEAHVLFGRRSTPSNKIHCIISRLFFCVWTTRTRYEGFKGKPWLPWATSLWLQTLCVNEAESQCAINDIADYRGWVDISKIISDPWTMEISLLQYWWKRCIIA